MLNKNINVHLQNIIGYRDDHATIGGGRREHMLYYQCITGNNNPNYESNSIGNIPLIIAIGAGSIEMKQRKGKQQEVAIYMDFFHVNCTKDNFDEACLNAANEANACVIFQADDKACIIEFK